LPGPGRGAAGAAAPGSQISLYQLITGLICRELRSEDLEPATYAGLDQRVVFRATTADRSVLDAGVNRAWVEQLDEYPGAVSGPAGDDDLGFWLFVDVGG
jgi:hypothetical protein